MQHNSNTDTLQQALSREIALDLLEGFFPNREDIDIYNPANNDIPQPHDITVRRYSVFMSYLYQLILMH